MRFLIEDSLFTGSGQNGISVMALVGGVANGNINRVSMTGFGIAAIDIGWSNDVGVSSSTLTGNEIAILVGSSAKLRLSQSVLTQNQFGVSKTGNPTIESAGDNFIRGNASNNVANLTKVGTN